MNASGTRACVAVFDEYTSDLHGHTRNTHICRVRTTTLIPPAQPLFCVHKPVSSGSVQIANEPADSISRRRLADKWSSERPLEPTHRCATYPACISSTVSPFPSLAAALLYRPCSRRSICCFEVRSITPRINTLDAANASKGPAQKCPGSGDAPLGR